MLEDHLEKLKHFSGVCRAGSIRSYSIKSGLSQSGISKAIQVLESAVEKTLFSRNQEGIELTTAGEILLKFADELSTSVSKVQADLRQIDGPQFEDSIRLGAYPSIAVYLFPKLFKTVSLEQKGISISFETMTSNQLLKELASRKLDLVISINPTKNRETVNIELFKDTYSLFRPTHSHQLISNKVFTFANAKCSLGISIAEYLKKFEKEFQMIDCGDFEAAKAMLASGVGYAVLPDRVAATLKGQGVCEEVVSKRSLLHFGEHSVSMSVRKSRETDKALQWIQKVILKVTK